MIDVDAAELAKPTIAIDLPIHADLKDFLAVLLKELDGYVAPPAHSAYVEWGQQRRRKYPATLPEYWDTQGVVNPYCFVERLFEALAENDVIVMADATAAVCTVQTAKLKHGQRLYSNSGAASMGYDLPATIGAWHAMKPGSSRIICLAGDGSIMQNLQELQTIVGQRIPAKIFLYNNSGYHSIRQAQQSYFDGFSVGCGPDSGITFPDFEKIATAFGLTYTRTSEHSDMARAIRDTLDAPGAALCEIIIDKTQNFAPKVSSRRLDDGTMVTAPMEDLAPFLPRDELAEALAVPE